MSIWHPFTQMRGFSPLGNVTGASGAWLDLEGGHRVVDGISSWWVNTHGHAHPKIAEAIAAQARRFDQVILADFAHGPAARLSELLPTLLPGDLKHCFYSDNGSTSVEVALKMAIQAQARLGQGQRKRFVAFTGAYHGDTVGAMSVGERGVFNEPFWSMLFDTEILPYDDADALEAFLEASGDEVAAVILEPMVQGAAGMVFSSAEFLARTAAACGRAGVLLIADEVMTGWGRTGTLFACEQAGVTPDILAASKGITGGTLPLGLTACGDRIYEAFWGSSKTEAFLHGHSYSGNPIACAAAIAALSLYDEEGTLQRIEGMEAQYRAAAPMFETIDGVEGLRCRGGIFACELRSEQGGYLDPIGRRVSDRTFPMGLYCRPLGNTLYLMPPFCISEVDLDRSLDQLFHAIRAELSR